MKGKIFHMESYKISVEKSATDTFGRIAFIKSEYHLSLPE